MRESQSSPLNDPDRPHGIMVRLPEKAPARPHVTFYDNQGVPFALRWSKRVDDVYREVCEYPDAKVYLGSAATMVPACVCKAAIENVGRGCPGGKQPECFGKIARILTGKRVDLGLDLVNEITGTAR